MTVTDEEVDDFLAHFGVKGMKWGVRKSGSSNNSSSKSSSRKKKVAVASAAAVAAAGSVFVARTLHSRGSTKMAQVRLTNTQVKRVQEQRKLFQQLQSNQTTLRKSANGHLRLLYNANEVPHNLRDYIP